MAGGWPIRRGRLKGTYNRATKRVAMAPMTGIQSSRACAYGCDSSFRAMSATPPRGTRRFEPRPKEGFIGGSRWEAKSWQVVYDDDNVIHSILSRAKRSGRCAEMDRSARRSYSSGVADCLDFPGGVPDVRTNDPFAGFYRGNGEGHR